MQPGCWPASQAKPLKAYGVPFLPAAARRRERSTGGGGQVGSTDGDDAVDDGADEGGGDGVRGVRGGLRPTTVQALAGRLHVLASATCRLVDILAG